MAKQHAFTSPRSVGHIPLISCDADPLADVELASVEHAVGPLPSDYRQFLLCSNGGRTADDEVRFRLSDDKDDFHRITGFTVIESGLPPELLTPTMRGAAHQLLKIADCNDSPILMQLNGPNAGTVYYWDYHVEDRWDAEEAGLVESEKADCRAGRTCGFLPTWELFRMAAPTRIG